jgi:hypothetical protein
MVPAAKSPAPSETGALMKPSGICTDSPLLDSLKFGYYETFARAKALQ